MRIYELADKPGKAGKWSSSDEWSEHWKCHIRVVRHYGTTMLIFPIDLQSGRWTGDPDQVDIFRGWGSVSDQQGVNQLLARIGAPYYYSRKDGASIVRLERPQFRYGISRFRPADRRGAENYPNADERP